MHRAKSWRVWFQTRGWDPHSLQFAADIIGNQALRYFWKSHFFAGFAWLFFFIIHKENLQRCRPNPNELCCNTPAKLHWIGTCGLHCSGWFSLFSGSSALGNTASLLTGKSDFMQYCSPSDPVEKGYHEEKKALRTRKREKELDF